MYYFQASISPSRGHGWSSRPSFAYSASALLQDEDEDGAAKGGPGGEAAGDGAEAEAAGRGRTRLSSASTAAAAAARVAAPHQLPFWRQAPSARLRALLNLCRDALDCWQLRCRMPYSAFFPESCSRTIVTTSSFLGAAPQVQRNGRPGCSLASLVASGRPCLHVFLQHVKFENLILRTALAVVPGS